MIIDKMGESKKIEDLAIPRFRGYAKPEFILTSTPKLDLDRARLREKYIYPEVTDKASAIAVSAYKNLRTQLLRTLDAQSIHSVMITGPTPGVGKSLTAINLAISIAMHSRRTALLVDLDLKAPSVHKYFGFQPNGGIVDVVTEDIPLASALISPGVERLTLLPGTQGYQDSSEILVSHNMEQIIKEIKSRYRERIVIFDTPPVLHCDDVSALVPLMDSCLMVIKEGETRKKELTKSLKQLGDIPVVGIVSNQSTNPIFNNPYY